MDLSEKIKNLCNAKPANTEYLKVEYNRILMRFYKAELYLDNAEIPMPEREKHIPSFKKLVDEMNRILSLIDKYTDNEVLTGFVVDDTYIEKIS